VSSAYFTSSFPGVTALRSAALTTYAAGPTVDPCTMLAVTSAVGDVYCCTKLRVAYIDYVKASDTATINCSIN